MPEEKNIKSILEQKWFWPVILIAVIAVAVGLVIYINLNGQVKVLNIRIESLEKTVSQFSKTGKEAVPKEGVILPEGDVTQKEGGETPQGVILPPHADVEEGAQEVIEEPIEESVETPAS